MSESNAHRLASEGKLPARKLGKNWYVAERLSRPTGRMLICCQGTSALVCELAERLSRHAPSLAIDADFRRELSHQLGLGGNVIVELLSDASVSPKAPTTTLSFGPLAPTHLP